MQSDFERINELAAQQFKFYSMEDYNAIEKADYFLVDEADECFEQFVTFDSVNNQLNGLYYLRDCTKAFLLTATTPAIVRSLVQYCLGGYDYQEHKSQYQITSKAIEPFEMTVYSYSNSDDQLKGLLQQVDLVKPGTPVLIFADKPEAIETQLRAKYKKVFYVSDD